MSGPAPARVPSAVRLERRADWLVGARRLPSPHFDARPAGTGIDLVVVHGISLPPGAHDTRHVEDLFLGRLDTGAHPYFAGLAGLRVSAHLLIGRDGEVVQFVALDRRAWHAGESRHEGRPRCNDFSVGIELIGSDEVPYTDEQYAVLGALVRDLMAAHPAISARRVVGHCHVAPGRKTDPGPAFDWPRLRRELGGAPRAPRSVKTVSCAGRAIG